MHWDSLKSGDTSCDDLQNPFVSTIFTSYYASIKNNNTCLNCVGTCGKCWNFESCGSSIGSAKSVSYPTTYKLSHFEGYKNAYHAAGF